MANYQTLVTGSETKPTETTWVCSVISEWLRIRKSGRGGGAQEPKPPGQWWVGGWRLGGALWPVVGVGVARRASGVLSRDPLRHPIDPVLLLGAAEGRGDEDDEAAGLLVRTHRAPSAGTAPDLDIRRHGDHLVSCALGRRIARAAASPVAARAERPPTPAPAGGGGGGGAPALRRGGGGGGGRGVRRLAGGRRGGGY